MKMKKLLNNHYIPALIFVAIFIGVGVVIDIFISQPYEAWRNTKTPVVIKNTAPNYDRESLLKLLEKGECAGGTIEEGKFSVFVCNE